MAQSLQDQLRTFDPAKAGTYNPGQVVIFFDHRGFKCEKDQMSRYQSYWLETKYRLGWPSFWYTSDLEPGRLRLVWYTVCLHKYLYATWHSYARYKLLTSPSTPETRVHASSPYI